MTYMNKNKSMGKMYEKPVPTKCSTKGGITTPELHSITENVQIK